MDLKLHASILLFADDKRLHLFREFIGVNIRCPAPVFIWSIFLEVGFVVDPVILFIARILPLFKVVGLVMTTLRLVIFTERSLPIL